MRPKEETKKENEETGEAERERERTRKKRTRGVATSSRRCVDRRIGQRTREQFVRHNRSWGVNNYRMLGLQNDNNNNNINNINNNNI